nr:HAMP domain-containing sensor histidine kinase [Kribbella catacumbae]
MNRWRPSLRARLAITFTLLVGVILVLVGVATNQLLRQSLLAEIERDVAHRAAAFRATPPDPPYTLDTFGARDVFLQVVGPDGAPVAKSASLGDRVLPIPDAARRGEVVEARVGGRPLFLTAAPLDAGRQIVVARSPMTTYGALRTLRNLLTGIIAGAVLLTALTSWLYARGALRPIGQVVAAARSVRDSRDLSRRVPQRSTGDEAGRLVETFNEMLAELQIAYESLDNSNQHLRQFLADCSHELRAPLARIRSTVDGLARLDDPDTGDAAFRSRALADVAADTDRMARMVRQLLILARADAGATIERRPIRLADVVQSACRQAERMSNGVQLSPPDDHHLADAVVLGDADHLEQAVLILLDNAFKYTPPPGRVEVRAQRHNSQARIDVTDTGLGVPPEDRDKIFDRFYRGRNARPQPVPDSASPSPPGSQPSTAEPSSCSPPRATAPPSPSNSR